MATWILVNMGSDNGLLPASTKPLPKPMFTKHHCDILLKTILQEMFKIFNLDMSLKKFLFNPLRPGDAYMHQLTSLSLIQMMACHLFGAKSLSEPMLACQLDSKEHISMEVHLRNQKFSVNKTKQNAFENSTCKMVVILCWPHCVKLHLPGASELK